MPENFEACLCTVNMDKNVSTSYSYKVMKDPLFFVICSSPTHLCSQQVLQCATMLLYQGVVVMIVLHPDTARLNFLKNE